MSSLSFILPSDALSRKGAGFRAPIRDCCGDIGVESMEIQGILSVDSLLRIGDPFDFFKLNSPDTDPLKAKIGIRLTADDSFVVRPGIRIQFDALLHALHALLPSSPIPIQPYSVDLVVSADLLKTQPFLRRLIEFYQSPPLRSGDIDWGFVSTFIGNFLSNIIKSKCRYRYSESVRSFALCLCIQCGRSGYEYARINLPGGLSSVSSLQTYIADQDEKIVEGEFRFDLMERHLTMHNSTFLFCAEDATGVIPKVHYDIRTNTFVGFTLPLHNGFPSVRFFSTDSFDQLEEWMTSNVETMRQDVSRLINVHVAQPISLNSSPPSPYLLTAYGTNSRYTFPDIIKRWIDMYRQCLMRNVRLIGYATDCELRYLKAMRLVLGFFASMPNRPIQDDPSAFEVDIPPTWKWFFMRSRQLFLCFQDGIHMATKLRNRLLSPKATLVFGGYLISTEFLLKLIESSSKVNHCLVKSDVNPKDRQNFAACEKISNSRVIDDLHTIQRSEATRVYLEVRY